MATLATRPDDDAPRDPDTADARTRQIVEAAYALLDEAGLEGLTIRAVLVRSGLARRAFYERFAGKDDLVVAVFAHAIGLAARRFADEVAEIAEPMARLRLLVVTIALGSRPGSPGEDDALRRRGAALAREHLRLADTRPDALRRALRPLIDLIARLLGEAMAAGTVRAAPPQRMAMLVYNLVSTTTHAELIAQEVAPADPSSRIALADDVWEFCRRAIAA